MHGYPNRVAHGHAWVHVSLLHMHIKAHPQSLHRDIENWFSFNSDKVVPGVAQKLGAKITANAPPGPMPPAPANAPPSTTYVWICLVCV